MPILSQLLIITALYTMTVTYSNCDDDFVGEAEAESISHNEVTSIAMNDEGILYTSSTDYNHKDCSTCL